MSNSNPPAAPLAAPFDIPRRVSWLGAVGLRLLGRRGAQLGLVWVALLALVAVFAPFFASSFPLVWHEGGKTSYPLFANLQPVDVVLVLAFVFALLLAACRRVPVGTRLGVWLWAVFALIPIGGWKVWSEMARRQPAIHWGGHWSREEQVAVAFWMGWLLVALLVAAFLLAFPFFSRAPRAMKAAVLALVLALAGVFACHPIYPPENFDHQHYRVAQAAGKGNGLFAPIPYSPQDALADQGNAAYLAPSRQHWMGTDTDGHDLASRMLHASRVSLTIGLLSTSIALFIGVVVGGLMGYFAGWFDLLGMRVVDVFSSIPRLPILIMICAFYERNIYLIMIILGLFGWVGYAVFIRAEFLRLRKADYVEAARSVGASVPRILVRHMLPNGIAPVLTLASFSVAGAIMTEATLSFLGLGLPPDAPSWGQPLQKAADAGPDKWWLVVFPGLAIFFTVFAYNLVGEALRDALDPKRNK